MLVGTLLVVGGVSVSVRARASTTVSLSFSAPDACPNQDDFVAAIRARRALLLGEGRLLRIDIERLGTGFRGVLRFDDVERTAKGATCEELVQALAVIASIALPEDPPEPVAPAPAKVEAPKAPEVAPIDVPSTAAPVEPPNERHTVVAAAFMLQALPVPSIGTGWALGGAIVLGARGSAPSPLFSLGALRSFETRTQSIDGGAIRWSLLRLDACPHVLTFAEGFEATACAVVTGGFVEVATQSFDRIDGLRRPWLTTGLGVRLSARRDPLFVAVQAGANLTLIRDTYDAPQHNATLSTPSWVGDLLLTTGVRFL